MNKNTLTICVSNTDSLPVANPLRGILPLQKYLISRLLLTGVFLIAAYGLRAQTDGFITSFNYNDGTTYGASQCSSDMGNCHYWSNSQNSQVYDKNLRIRFEANKPGTSSGITAKLNVNGDRVYSMEYRIKFDNGFQWREGGKLPGLAGGQAPSGGTVGRDIARAGNGFSTRFMWRPNGKLVVYTYYRDQSGDYGDDWDCGHNFQAGTWYTLKQKVTVNTGSNKDGRVEVWVDGVKKLDKTNVRLMTNNNSVNVVFFDTFMGGGNSDFAWSPTKTQYLRIDDVKVAKRGSAPTPTKKDAIVSVAPPHTVNPGGVARVKVSYFASANRDLQVDLQGDGNPNYNPYGSGKIAVPAGDHTVEVEVPVNSSIPLAMDAYQFQVYLSPTDQGWSKRTASQAVSGVDAVKTTSPNPTVDTLYNVKVPPTISPGTQTNLTVHYEASAPRDLYVVLQPDMPNYRPQYINLKTSVSAGKNTVEIPLSIPADIPLAQDAYQFQIYLTPTDKGWFDRLHNRVYTNIDAVAPPATALHIRAKSSQGSEQMSLWVADKKVQSWTVATTATTYSYPDYTGGVVKVSFDNDGGSGSSDRNLAINYIEVCGVKYESNGPGVVRTNCGTDNDQGFAWLYCQGSFLFGPISCSSNARTGATVSKADQVTAWPAEGLWAYPNPATDYLNLRGADAYQVSVYELSGRQVMSPQRFQGNAQLNISKLRPGIYLLKMEDLTKQHPSLQQRIIVN